METRDTYFDNLKTILIFLVVLGHFTYLKGSIPLIGAINNVIYSFHMPLFIFISGYFSKSIKSQRASEIENILYPYLVFQLFNLVFTKLTGLGSGSTNVFIPTYQNWYLLGLLFWRVAIPYYNLFNKTYALFFTIILSFIVGFFDGFGTFLGLYRIIYFFPIFIIGYYCSDLRSVLNAVSKYRYYFIGISLLGIIAVFFVSIFSSKYRFLISFGYTPYLNYGHSLVNFILRLVGFFSSLVISFGLLFLIPQKKFKVTHLGENTLNIFLLHMFFVFPLNHYLVNVPSYIVLLIALVSSVLICIVCSNRFINEVLAPLTKLKRLKLLLGKL